MKVVIAVVAAASASLATAFALPTTWFQAVRPGNPGKLHFATSRTSSGCIAMRLSLLLALLVAACSSGSGTGPFTPSTNILVTHPRLLGFWIGSATSDAGETASIAVAIENIGLRDAFRARMSSSGSTIPGMPTQPTEGIVQADGNRVMLSVPQSMLTLTGLDMSGRFDYGGSTGSLMLARDAPALGVEATRYVDQDIDLTVIKVR